MVKVTEKPEEQSGELVRDIREGLEIGLEELARRAQISAPMLSQFERGNRKLSPKAWARVWNALDKISRKLDFTKYAERRLRVEAAVERYFPEIAARHRPNQLLKYALCQPENLATYLQVQQRVKEILDDPAQDEETQALVAEYIARIKGRNERWIESLERAQSEVRDPVFSEIILSFRNEIAELEQQNAELQRRLAKGDADDD